MKSEQLKEPTVEEVLAELREMFPEQLISIHIRDYRKAREWFIHVGFTFQAITLSEVMDQVRKWHKEQQ